MKVYKLTTRNMKTRTGYDNETVWGEGVTHTTDGEGELCGPGWLHFYYHPVLAVILNGLHTRLNLEESIMWEAKAEGKIKSDHRLKGGCTILTTIKQIPIPELSRTQKIAFAILCEKSVNGSQRFTKWAMNWLNDIDRGYVSALNIMRTAQSDNVILVADIVMYSRSDAYVDDVIAATVYKASKLVVDHKMFFDNIIKQWNLWVAEESTRSLKS